MWYKGVVEWSRVASAFMLPLALWLLTFAVLAVQLLWLLLFETRVASGIIEKKFSDYVVATFAVGALVHYDRVIAVPLLASLYPDDFEANAREAIIIFLAGMSLLSAGVAFHYSISSVTRFKGRSLLVFPQAVYEKDPVSVRRLWIKIFNLIGLTSMATVALLHVYIYAFARIFDKRAEATSVLPYIAGLVVAAALVKLVRSLILRFPSTLVLMAKLNQVIAQNSKSPDTRRSLSPRKADPLSFARGELVQAARILERLARREDSRFGADMNHPVAAIYRAVADHIRSYCNSPKSLEGPIPPNTITILKATQGFMITGDGVWRRHLIKQLNIFQSDGTPRPLATAPSPTSAVSIFRTSAGRADRALIWLQGRWQAILIAVAIGAFLLGQLDLKSLLEVAP